MKLTNVQKVTEILCNTLDMCNCLNCVDFVSSKVKEWDGKPYCKDESCKWTISDELAENLAREIVEVLN